MTTTRFALLTLATLLFSHHGHTARIYYVEQFPAIFKVTLYGETIEVSHNHYGYNGFSFPYFVWGLDRASYYYDLTAPYSSFTNPHGRRWSFERYVLRPYLDQQRTQDSNYQLVNDSQAPRPDNAAGTKVINKYLELTGQHYYQLTVGNDDYILSGVQVEMHPYVMQDITDSAMAGLIPDQFRSEYHLYYQYPSQDRAGRDEMVHLAEDKSYWDSSVDYNYWFAWRFLSLTEKQKIGFMKMYLERQFDSYNATNPNHPFGAHNIDEYIKKHRHDKYAKMLSEGGWFMDKIAQDDAIGARPGNTYYRFNDKLKQFNDWKLKQGITEQYSFFDKFKKVYRAQIMPLDFSPVAKPLNEIYNVYMGVLNRLPDKGGFEYWLKEHLKLGRSISQIGDGFVRSAEFRKKAGIADGVDPDFDAVLTGLYKVILNRKPDDLGYKYWKKQYERETWKKPIERLGGIVAGFIQSEELEKRIVAEKHAWFAINYGPNLYFMDWDELGFKKDQRPKLTDPGWDENQDHGFKGIDLRMSN